MADAKQKYDIEKLLEEGTYIQIPIQGWSMYPLLTPGRDQACVKRCQPQELKRGDVVLYRRDEGILVLHRICRITDEGIYLVGDNQSEVEGPLRPDQIKGIADAFIRNGKRIDAEQITYRFLTSSWLILRPLRPYITKPAAALKRLFRK